MAKKKSVKIPVRWVSRDAGYNEYEIRPAKPGCEKGVWLADTGKQADYFLVSIPAEDFETMFPHLKMPGGKNSCRPFVVLDPNEYDIQDVNC